MSRNFKTLSTSLIPLAFLTCSTALAQNATNEAWIGQTGETNTITVVQTGSANKAGANASLLQINQDGRFNEVDINQLGYSNTIGAQQLNLPNAPSGVNQIGDRNTLSINQSNENSLGSNTVGAIYQASESNGNTIANSLVVEQSATGGDGNADHVLGFVTQINNVVDSAANVVNVNQSGGSGGSGNTINSIVQEGDDNLVDVDQRELTNLIGSLRQKGSANEMSAEQGEGESGTILDASQVGARNQAKVRQSGDRNYVDSILQNNEGVAIAGNSITLMLAGNDNGGDGTGGPGTFRTATASDVGVFQASFTQIGDDNAIGFTVNGGSENQYGIAQYGTGNGAIVAISRLASDAASPAARNEVAILQDGTDSNLAVTVAGNDNTVGASMEGERNRGTLSQSGTFNDVSLEVSGKDNNNDTSLSGAFTGDVGVNAASLGLTPGDGLQSGNRNTATIRIDGNANMQAFSQDGNDNLIDVSVNGSLNQNVIGQTGDFNSATVGQFGTGNQMVVIQF